MGKVVDADDKLTDSQQIDEVLDQFQTFGALLPGGAVAAQAANVAEFSKRLAENGFGYSFSDADRVDKVRRGILANKKEIYKNHKEDDVRHQLLEDVITQYKDEEPGIWGAVLDKLKEKKVAPKAILERFE